MIKLTFTILIIIGVSLIGEAQSRKILLKEESKNHISKSTPNKDIGLSLDTITDIDGNIYQIVKIGNQAWMKDNLRVTRFRNGDIIPNISDNVQWISQNSPALCSYGNKFNQANELRIGLLYNGFTVQDKREVCPEGWRIPSDSDFYQLIKVTGGPFAAINLKSEDSGNTLWKQYSYASSSKNEIGFSILPAGGRKNDFEGLFESAYFLTNRIINKEELYAFYTNYASDSFNRITVSKSNGLSIRCIKE